LRLARAAASRPSASAPRITAATAGNACSRSARPTTAAAIRTRSAPAHRRAPYACAASALPAMASRAPSSPARSTTAAAVPTAPAPARARSSPAPATLTTSRAATHARRAARGRARPATLAANARRARSILARQGSATPSPPTNRCAIERERVSLPRIARPFKRLVWTWRPRATHDDRAGYLQDQYARARQHEHSRIAQTAARPDHRDERDASQHHDHLSDSE